MATTRLFSLHIGKGRNLSTAISDVIDYGENPDKTDGGRLVTSYECDSRIADEEFLLSKREYHYKTGRDQGRKDVFAYHIRQSFKPGEVSPEEANEIGRELGLSFTKGNHAFIVCTHIDKHHVHNHIIFNSTALNCERKFEDFKRSGMAIRRISDLLCARHGLSVIENPKPSRGSYGTWLGDRKEPCFQDKMRMAIDAALARKPEDFETFLAMMKAVGYAAKHGKHIKLTGPGQQRGTRLDTLKGNYTEQAIRERIAGTRVVVSTGGGMAEPMPEPSTEFSLLIDIQEKLRQGKGAGYANWARSFNLKEAAKTLIFLQEAGVRDYAELEKKTSAASADFRAISAKIKAAEKRMAEVSELQKQIGVYSKTREVYARYKASGWSRKFYDEHAADIILHRAAKKFFDGLNLKPLPKIAALKQEYAALLAEKKRLYSGYHEARENMRQLVKAKQNADLILSGPVMAKGKEKQR